jgi:hypothetical protein
MVLTHNPWRGVLTTLQLVFWYFSWFFPPLCSSIYSFILGLSMGSIESVLSSSIAVVFCRFRSSWYTMWYGSAATPLNYYLAQHVTNGTKVSSNKKFKKTSSN